LRDFGYVLAIWPSRREVHLSVQGSGDDDLSERLDRELQRVLNAGALHVVVNLHRLSGNDRAVLELLAATCHRLWRVRGVMEINGVRDRLATSVEVRTLPEVFGDITSPDAALPALR
jgi:anti-anti-sigma regulatory factor